MPRVGKLISEFFPRAVEEGKFGKDIVRFIDYKRDDGGIAAVHGCSTVYFGDLIMETDRGDQSIQSIVIKARDDEGKSSTGGIAPWQRLSNEYLFYAEILPLLQKCDRNGSISKMFPKFFFGRLASSDDDTSEEFLVFENVRKRGFKHSPMEIFMDYDHLKLIYRKIAEFHALSYVCKKRYPREFEEITSKIRELMYTEEEIIMWNTVFNTQSHLSVSTLQQNPEYRERVSDLSKVVENTGYSLRAVAGAVEPLSIICHGDLQRNNIFFRYDSEGKSPTELIIIDLALTRYASPTIDISFILFANALPETRTSKWTELLKIYHSTLTSYPDLDIQMAPSFDDLILDFRRRAFHGYGWGCLFLVYILSKINKPQTKEDDELKTLTLHEICQLRLKRAGERGAIYLKENAKFMIDENFDFGYILNLKLNS